MSENKEEVSVSEETMKEVNEEVEKVENEKLEAAKQEGKAEAVEESRKSLEDIRKELEEAKAATAKLAEEQERQRLEAELAAEHEKLKAAEEEPVKKRVVPESANPAAPQPEPQVSEQKLRPEDEWEQALAAVRTGQVPLSGSSKDDI